MCIRDRVFLDPWGLREEASLRFLSCSVPSCGGWACVADYLSPRMAALRSSSADLKCERMAAPATSRVAIAHEFKNLPVAVHRFVYRGRCRETPPLSGSDRSFRAQTPGTHDGVNCSKRLSASASARIR